ncbi:MAG: hypothetical protein OSJ66_08960 [Clostridia bacterium]|nr:hypothetical protein [Clostridia bacterium]
MLSKIVTVFLCLAVFLPQIEVSNNADEIYQQDIILQEETEESVSFEGLVEEDGNYYYYKNGKHVKNKLVTIGNDKYYLKNDGSAAKGVMFIKEKFYYFGNDMKYNAAKTKKIRNAAKYEKPFFKLKKLIGKPDKAKYYSSCYGKGKDGVLKYKYFKVYTFKPDKGKEIYMGAE